MKRTEAVSLIHMAFLQQKTAEQILVLIENEIGMNPPGDPGGESECGWEPEQPVQYVPSPLPYPVKKLLEDIERDMYQL
jgi:hypothetical protein